MFEYVVGFAVYIWLIGTYIATDWYISQEADAKNKVYVFVVLFILLPFLPVIAIIYRR